MATILLVEDEASMRLLTSAKLKHQFTVICAQDGVEALEVLERRAVDLIIADVMMPRMDGYTLVKTLRERGNQIPVLLLTKLESQQFIAEKHPYSLDEQIKRCAILLSPAWEKKQISFTANLEPAEYDGNEELMRHVWLNLLNNAVKYTPEGGEITVTLQVKPQELAVTVADTGIGMSEEVRSHVFDKYYQGNPSGTQKGLGLGLSIVARIVELCGGRIQVDSVEDQGSAFTVFLPREE